MVAPVAIFVYNRVDHTKQTLEALMKNNLATETDVYVFCDNYKNENSRKAVELTREYINSLKNNNPFKSFNVEYAEKNKGLANSIIYGVTKVIDKYNKIIVLEDDLVSSENFLSYMNQTLNFYNNDMRIWSISGYTFNIDIPKEYNESVYLSYRGSSWGWATWKNRWDKVDWSVKDYNEFKNNYNKRRAFNRGGRDMSVMLDAQMLKKCDSWAIRWCYSQHRENMYTIYPVKSYINNIGVDGSGTHRVSSDKYSVELIEKNNKLKLDNVIMNDYIIKKFRDNFGGFVKFILSNIKWYILRNFYSNR